jgi:hypothetical protein
MKHTIVACCLLMLLLLCAVGSKMILHPPLSRYLVPGATDIRVVGLGWNEWQISYHAPGSIATWSTIIGRNLEADAWTSPGNVGYGALSRSYTRASSLAFCALWEWAFLSFDPVRPHVAQIRVRRWIAIPWWGRLSQRASIPNI